MKNFTLTFLFLSLTILGQAQITLNDWELGKLESDTNFLTIMSGVNSFPAIGANQTWDYSSSSFSSVIPIPFYPVSPENQLVYPDANTQRTWWQSDLNGGYTMDTMMFSTDERGFNIEGTQDESWTLNLNSYTGGTADEFKKLSGDRVWSNPGIWVSTPLNYGDTSEIIGVSSTMYEWDVPSMGQSNVQMERRRIMTSGYNVVGWGNLILTNPNTMLVDTFEVLLQTRHYVKIDSFFDASGALMSNSLLNILSLTQGQQTDGYQFYEFFTRGPGFAALTIEYPYGNSSPSTSYITGNLFEEGFNVATKEPQFVQTPHRIYPNPIRDHHFQLDVEKTSAENWTLNIHNIMGRLIQTEQITNNVTEVSLDSRFPTGTYIYSIIDENDKFLATGKLNLVD
jgi:hypothetical protein